MGRISNPLPFQLNGAPLLWLPADNRLLLGAIVANSTTTWRYICTLTHSTLLGLLIVSVFRSRSCTTLVLILCLTTSRLAPVTSYVAVPFSVPRVSSHFFGSFPYRPLRLDSCSFSLVSLDVATYCYSELALLDPFRCLALPGPCHLACPCPCLLPCSP